MCKQGRLYNSENFSINLIFMHYKRMEFLGTKEKCMC
jgi:hypothetical protein